MLTDHDLKQLHKLAHDRVVRAINSVGQLLETEEQSLHLLMDIVAQLSVAAAIHLHENTRMPNGKQPSQGEAFAKVLSMIAAVQGLESRVLNEDEAKQIRLIK
jgi:hypothetical protein